MSIPRDKTDVLHRLFAEWRRLSEAEHAAISDGQWQALAGIQRSKLDLEAKLSKAREVWDSATPSEAARQVAFERELRPVVEELVGLETLNQRMLDSRFREAVQALATFGLTEQRLRSLRRAYGSSRPAAWNSYS